MDSGDYYSVTGMMEATVLGTRLGYGRPFGERVGTKVRLVWLC